MNHKSFLFAFVIAVSAAGTTTAAAQSHNPGRLLGVFDDATGKPVAGAEVVDLATNTRAVTPASGAISLTWLGAGTTILAIRKIGYAALMVPVTVSATDTTSITIVLKPLAQTLPAVVSKTRPAADTVRRLEIAGFYDRKRSSGAPESAFVTAEQLAEWNLSLLSDVRYHTGREIGRCDDVYINGISIASEQQLETGSRVRQNSAYGFRRRGIDALVNPDDVLGMEMYRIADAPSAFDRTKPPGCGPSTNVILIWLK
ncbi:MAG TPA: carboxypeptidase-like regulatory domain-containing protein [Gemmatimonadaceae bacterium]|nr:carboxypeptidase-like regulatory domain-containing protein [Gemmatimonadaceae bacterium]